jgi:hypothetical protein
MARRRTYVRNKQGEFAKVPGRSLGKKPSAASVKKATGAAAGNGSGGSRTSGSNYRTTSRGNSAGSLAVGDRVYLGGTLEQVQSVKHHGDGSGGVEFTVKSGTFKQHKNDFLDIRR